MKAVSLQYPLEMRHWVSEKQTQAKITSGSIFPIFLSTQIAYAFRQLVQDDVYFIHMGKERFRIGGPPLFQLARDIERGGSF